MFVQFHIFIDMTEIQIAICLDVSCFCTFSHSFQKQLLIIDSLRIPKHDEQNRTQTDICVSLYILQVF